LAELQPPGINFWSCWAGTRQPSALCNGVAFITDYSVTSESVVFLQPMNVWGKTISNVVIGQHKHGLKQVAYIGGIYGIFLQQSSDLLQLYKR
jgi:hypothetical protein